MSAERSVRRPISLTVARLVLVVAVALGPSALLAFGDLPPAGAATVTVTNTGDLGPGSLRQAVADAAAGDTIRFDLTGCPCTIGLLGGQIAIGKNLTITGPGSD